MKETVKTALMYVLKLLLSPLKLFSMQNYVMFCTNSGGGYYCNPKYIYEYLIKNNKMPNYKFIWCFKNPEKYRFLESENTIICKYRSLKYYYYKVVSKVYISNSIEGNETPKKKKQIRIQTWHGGGCYKKVALAEKARSNIYKKRTENNMKNTDIFISSSKVFTDEVIKNNFFYSGKILETGMPRNDILFDKEKHASIRKKVLDFYNIDDSKFIALYAPTWRYDESKLEEIDFKSLKEHLEKKFGKDVVIIYRAHLHMQKDKIDNLISGSEYEDMQDLLIASDLLITDYSSSIWDYSFLYKPCFLFCPDLDYYIENRGFVIDIYEWGFPVSKSNDSLMEQIDNFNLEEFKEKMDKHHNALGYYETGKAAEYIAKYIEEEF